MKQIKISLLLLLSFTTAYAAPNWELKKDKEGIKVFSGHVPNSDIKAVKAECILNTSLSELTALLLDPKAHEQWVYSTTKSYLVKKISDQEQIYYSEMSMPWPLSNRDVVVDLKITQDHSTRVVSVVAIVTPGYVPLKGGIVRVPMSEVSWTVTPVGDRQVKIEYIGRADPGGSVPTWAVNMFCDKGPFETFKKLRTVLASGAYRNAHPSFIKD